MVAFELRAKAVIVQFQDGACYEYTERSTGKDAIATMKRLAVAGVGLSAYISRYAHNAYSRKLH